MSTIIEAPKKRDFVPHEAGTFVAILRDAYINEEPNTYHGKPRDPKDPSKGIDTREFVNKITLEFLTDQMIEIGGKMQPSFVSYRATASLADNASLRKFIGGWFPQLKDEDYKRFDADKLVGRGAYITVAHNVSQKNGNTYANVVGAMQPPKGSTLPVIPADFVRKDARPVAPPPTEKDEPRQDGYKDDFQADLNEEPVF